MGGSGADRVYASDLEKAVQYSLTNEILTHVRTFETVFQKRFFSAQNTVKSTFECFKSENGMTLGYCDVTQSSIEQLFLFFSLAQPVIDSDKLSTLYMYLEVLSKYLPVRQEVRDFIVSLREWPIKMGLTSIDSDSLQDKVRSIEKHSLKFQVRRKKSPDYKQFYTTKAKFIKRVAIKRSAYYGFSDYFASLDSRRMHVRKKKITCAINRPKKTMP